ncbi:MAG TPA: exo-beta-N-acetylmuramidase NamZ domain-containing protein [Thermoguttaceae bacterium]|nr:exo-beta-N-acetylmuramidase NamZ domain-containing protein [Thermoguttaceae bacterium]
MTESRWRNQILLGATVAFCLLQAAAHAAMLPAKLPAAAPEDVGMDSARLVEIDQVAAEGIAAGEMPGCVVMIGRRGKVVFFKAYGDRQVEPEPIAMTTDTVFDMASLTKPVATATSIMILIQEGKLRLEDRVAEHVPEFAAAGKDRITVLELLTHQGGLIPDNALADYEDGPEKAWERIFALKPRTAPGVKFIYTDVGYLVLGKLVERITGKSVHEFARKHIYQPLSMTETGYLPPEPLRRRAAPTEKRDDQWMQGEVHDPRAYLLGGVAGHAGLFSTAEDLAKYAQMMLGRGEYGGARVLSPATVAMMTTPYPVSSGRRGLGWDMRTGYSSNRGRSFSDRAFGHGGFTGTAMWIDPELELFVIFLSNRLHPDGKGSVNPLAGRIGTIAADAIRDRPTPPVLAGIDVLRRDGFRQLAGRRVGLITNQTGISREGVSTVQLLHDAENVELAALFSPEHGLEGKLDVSRIADGRHQGTGLAVFSLYGETRRPTPEMLQRVDTLVFDIQDIGARFYTYISTMGYAMEEAAKHGVRFVVLDRPNPIGGVEVAGPMLDARRESFVAYHRLPVRHGMTVGELAGLFKQELDLELDLEVIRVEEWQRPMLFDETGLRWVNPSPNMRSLTEAILYPGIGLLETTNLSVGRGTDTPFEHIGAPWLDGSRLVQALDQAGLPGIEFRPVEFTPDASKFKGERCGGIAFKVTDRSTFQPIRTGLEIARQLRLLYPDDWKAEAYDRLLGNKEVYEAVLSGKTVDEIEALYRPGLEEFLEQRSRFLLYEP